MKIRFGIIGCGYIGNRHAEHITAHPEAELVAAFDIKPEKTEALCKKYNAIQSSSLSELLSRNDIDIVNVCTPNGLHFECAKEALANSKNVIVEKPMALRKAECEDLVHLALRKNKQLFVVKQNRFNPPVQAVKQLISEKKLGEIYYVVTNCFWNRNKEYYLKSDWKGKKDLDGGTLYTQFSHFVDILYYLFGDIDISSISGIAKNVNHGDLIEFEDTGSFTFKFKNGALGCFNYTTAAYEKNMEGSFTIFAENGTIKIGGQYLNTLDYQRTNGIDITNLPASGPANDYGFYQGSMSNHDKIIHNVVETLNGRESIMTNAMEGMKVVEIIESVYNSVKWIK